MKEKRTTIKAINVEKQESHKNVKKESLNDYDEYLYQLFYKRVGLIRAKTLYSGIMEHKELMEDK